MSPLLPSEQRLQTQKVQQGTFFGEAASIGIRKVSWQAVLPEVTSFFQTALSTDLAGNRK